MDTPRAENRIDRRTFLHSTAAIAMAPMVAAASTGSKADDINVALVGGGQQGMTLLEAARTIPGVRFRAACDIWPYHLKWVSGRMRSYRHPNTPYADFDEMLAREKDLDAVIIATPDFWHARYSIAAMKAGLHVYCEKEMSNTLEDARKMVHTAKETGKLLQIGHQRRSNPIYRHCIDKLIGKANILGQITTVNGQWNRAAKALIGAPEKHQMDPATLKRYGYESMTQLCNWRWYKDLGGGPIVDLGSHQIDIYNWFLGAQPKSVYAHGGANYFDPRTHQWPDNVMAIYEYETAAGPVSAFYQTIATNSNNGYFETFMGNEGTLVISESAGRTGVYPEPYNDKDHWNKWVTAGYVNAPEEEPEPEPEITGALDARESVRPPKYEMPFDFREKYHLPHLENFFNAVRGKEKLNCPAEVGYETAVAVLKVNEAIAAGKKLTFAPREFTA